MRTPSVDVALLERLKAGDQEAVADLADAYGSKIYQLAFRYLKNREDAEEVAQDVLYKIYRKVGAFRGDSALSSWIYRITFNAAMSRLRAARFPWTQEEGRPRGWTAEDGDGPPLHTGDVPDRSELADERIFRSELRGRLSREILALPPIYRAPVLLRDLRGLSTEEASAVLRVKDQTLKSRLHRGRLILRKKLTEFATGLALRRPVPCC